MLQEFAAVGLLNPILHAANEPGLTFEHSDNRVLNQLVWILAVGGCYLLELRLDVG